MENIEVKNIPKSRWFRIIPPCILVYIIAYMDRQNISFAIAGGMNRTLGIGSTVAGIAAGIFYVGYVILQIPGGNYAEHKSAKKFILKSIMAWGLISIITGFVNQTWELLALRFALGVAEGGVMPAILVLITHWFPNEERGMANGFFAFNFAIASVITAPLSGWIISFSNWRWVFIIEGIIAFMLIFIWYPMISDSPEEAKWISCEEKEWLVERLKEEQRELKEATRSSEKKQNIYASSSLWLLTITYFCYQVGIYGYSLWLPTLIKELTKTGIGIVGLLSAVPYVGLIFGIWIFSYLSDKTQKRKLFAIIPMIFFALSLTFSVKFKANIWTSYVFLALAGVFIHDYYSSFWSLPPMLFESDVSGAARGFINGIGCLGGFIGPYLVGLVMTYTNSSDIGMYILAIVLLIGCFFNAVIKLPTIIKENRN
jgi:sugar phosphate permease